MKYSRVKLRYRVRGGGFAYLLKGAFTLPTTDYVTPYFTLTTRGWLLIRDIYAWDGATKFPDFDWIKTPSCIHDVLHQLIADGVLPESENDLIDEELEYAIDGNVGKRWLMKARGWYVRKATNTVDEKAGTQPEVFELPPLPNEITLEQYHAQFA